MSLELYCYRPSPHCRAVLLGARCMGVELNTNEVNVHEGQHKEDDFVAINPLKTVPVLVDEDLKLTDSHAILSYLANKYVEDDSFYPKDPVERAKVDSMMYFGATCLGQRAMAYYGPVIYLGEAPDERRLERLMDAVKHLNNCLGEHEYVAGDCPTIADFAMVPHASSMTLAGVLDIGEYENITNWLARCAENLDGFEEINLEEGAKFVEFIKSKFEAAAAQ